MDASEIEAKVSQALESSDVSVYKSSDAHGEERFEIIVVSDEFEAIPLIEQHQLVRDALGDLLDEMHAIEITTKTP